MGDTTKVKDGSTGTNPPSEEAQIEEILNLPVPGGKVTTSTFAELIGTKNGVVDLSKLEIPRLMNVTIPGVVSGAHKVLGAKAIWELGKSKGLSESDRVMVQWLMQSFQSFITHSTSPSVSNASNRVVSGMFDGKEVKVSHEELKTVLDNQLAGFGYENTMRQFGRGFSTSIIQMLAAGKLEVNTKICASHGIPPNYYAYSPDCLLVDARLFGYDASLASELGKMVAINKANSGNRRTHNLFEETGVAPDIFMGGRK